jgi:excisionase family DNA binding protein
MPPIPSDQLPPAALTVPEFCRWVRIGRTTLYAEVKAGRIKLRKIGAKSVILRSDGDAWLRSLPTTAETA